MVLVLGLMTDLFSGLPLIRSSRSWTARLLGIFAFGMIYLLGEGAFGWIGGRDKVTDAFGKRVSHFVLLLGLVLACCAAFAAVIWMAH